MKKLNNEGSHVVVLVLGVLVIGAVGLVGYRVYSTRGAKTNTAVTATQAKEEAKEWTEGDFAVAGTYADADVVQISEGQWRMYYAIQPEVQGNKFEVFSSVSTDGKTWTKEPGTRKTSATFPEVTMLSDGRYRMYFQNAATIKSAISSDGLTFTDEPGTRIDKSSDSGLVFDNVAAPTVIADQDGSYIMVYRGTVNTRYAADTPNPTTQLLFWATSPDGLTFTKKGIAVDTRNDTLRGQLDGPKLIKWDDGKIHVFATTYAGVYEFIKTNDTFGDGKMAYTTASAEPTKPQPGGAGNVKPPDTAPPGDPTLAKINGTWYMYYGGPRSKNGILYATYK